MCDKALRVPATLRGEGARVAACRWGEGGVIRESPDQKGIELEADKPRARSGQAL